MNWFLFGLLLTILILVSSYCFYWKTNYQKLWDVVKKIAQQQDYDTKLFNHHFKVTDETIVDLRKERDYWKKKALDKSKKSYRK